MRLQGPYVRCPRSSTIAFAQTLKQASIIPKICTFWSNYAPMKPPKELQKLIYCYTSNCNNPVSTCNIPRHESCTTKLKGKQVNDNPFRWRTGGTSTRPENLLANWNRSAFACFLTLLMFIYFLLPSASCWVLCSFKRRRARSGGHLGHNCVFDIFRQQRSQVLL